MAKEDKLADSIPRTRRRKTKEPVLTETILGVLAVVAVMIAALLVFSMVHAGGQGGEILFTGLYSLVGVFSYLTPLICLYVAYYLWKEELPEVRFMLLLGTLFVILGIAGLGTIISPTFSGLLGLLITAPLVKYFSLYPSFALLGGVTLIGAIIVLERKPDFEPLLIALSYPLIYIKRLLLLRKERPLDDEPEELKPFIEEDMEVPAPVLHDDDDTSSDNLRKELFGELAPPDETNDEPVMRKEIKVKPILLTPEFVPPPLDLLNVDSGKSGAGDSKGKMTTIQRTLEHFRIHVEMGEVTVGPTVTQFTLKPAQGVNLSKVVALHDNLAMELGSEFLRIEAPIPGKTLVGIEIPNERKSTLGLRA
jgi:S-DNA-T family DNA segregation ATPase FtsK/SpoIIIE